MDYQYVKNALYDKDTIKKLFEKYNCSEEFTDYLAESLIMLYNAMAYFFCTNEEARIYTEGKEDILVTKLNEAIETQIAFIPHKFRTIEILEPHQQTLKLLSEKTRLDVIRSLLGPEYDSRFDPLYHEITKDKDE